MTTQEHELSPIKREFLARLMAAPEAVRTVMMELLVQWKNGVGPDKTKAAVAAWFHNREAEIEARGKGGRPAAP